MGLVIVFLRPLGPRLLRDELGYIIPKDPLVLSPEQFGTPQGRQRVFIPGVLKEKTNTLEKNKNIDFEELMLNNQHNNSDDKKVIKYNADKFLEKNDDKKYFINKKNEKDVYLLKVFDA